MADSPFMQTNCKKNGVKTVFIGLSLSKFTFNKIDLDEHLILKSHRHSQKICRTYLKWINSLKKFLINFR